MCAGKNIEHVDTFVFMFFLKHIILYVIECF